MSRTLPRKGLGDRGRTGGLPHPGQDSHVETVCCRQKPPLGHQHRPTAVLPAPQPQAHLPGPFSKRGCTAAHYPGQGPWGCQAAVCERAGTMGPVQRVLLLPPRGWDPNPAPCALWEGQRVASCNTHPALPSQSLATTQTLGWVSLSDPASTNAKGTQGKEDI